MENFVLSSHVSGGLEQLSEAPAIAWQRSLTRSVLGSAMLQAMLFLVSVGKSEEVVPSGSL